MYRLTTPLRRRSQPFLLQKYNSDFNLNEYDEINSDGLFYLVEKEDTMLLVVHPDMPSTSVIYTEFYIKNIKMIDAVKVHDKEVLFVFNGTNMLAWMFAENPKLRIRWKPNQANFTMNVTAFNEKSRS
jgi:quinolinate synthase